ncbi:hypothetical protein [Dryocola clanedunensis]|uniref:hypothetical protein n=1 Tax=Dryocola clanedunensis TaxID=2925396 RepID=UPI0038CC047C
MSMIQNLIKKAFGTENVNEAASFLASACNRMKNSTKAEILYEIEQALIGVNLHRLPVPDAGMATRLKKAETEAANLRAELEDLRHKTPAQSEVQRLSARIATLQTNLDETRAHHYRELALVRETMQRKMSDLHNTMQQDIDSQRELRAELVKNGHSLVETVLELQLQAADLKNQLELVETQGASDRAGFEEALRAHQNYISVLKNDLSESRTQAEGYNTEILAQIQINLTLQSTLDELMKTTQNQGFAKENGQGERTQSSGSQSFSHWIAEK